MSAAVQCRHAQRILQRRELAEAVKALKERTGAARVALVGSSRGGNAIRNLVKNGGGADVSHAVLCGTPNHGVFDWEDSPNSEFNGRGPFLRGLNAGDSEVTAGTAFMTLRSDGLDKYAQADGRLLGKPGVPTGITADGPALKGATNLVIGTLDHREVAFHPRAFREIYKFIAGREPALIAIQPEREVRISGLVTGTPGGAPTNRPVAGAIVIMARPRGYFGLPRDIVLLDGKEPADIQKGVPTDAATTLRLPAGEVGRSVTGLFNEERIAADRKSTRLNSSHQ